MRDIKVERLLQINVAVLAALGTLLLGMGQGSALLPALSIVAAISSLILTDHLGLLKLNRNIANIAAVLAVALSLGDFFQHQHERQLLAVANLLVYLQIILLHQEKNQRLYWQLIILSLLQVVVASALSLGFEFGVLLVFYMFTSMTALVLFFAHRESQRYGGGEGSRSDIVISFRPTTERRSQRRDRRRWPLPTNGSLSSAMTYEEMVSRVIGFNTIRHISLMGLGTMLFTIVLFFTMPRFSDSNWQGRGGSSTIVGFTQEVKLNEIGKALESPEIVMRVNLSNPRTGESVTVAGEPYFRGTVLTEYEKGGTWRHDIYARAGLGRVRKLDTPPQIEGIVNQEIVLEPTGDVLLFSAFPAYQTQETPKNIRFEPATKQLFRAEEKKSRLRSQFAYQLATTAFDPAGRQKPYTPAVEYEHSKLRKFDPDQFPGLIETADRIIAESNTTGGSRIERAKALEAHFRDITRYDYTLDFDLIQRDPNLDPIEDFVVNHRSGHCEYFASALTIMLRSQGIPSRMVVGYKGGQFNRIGHFYQVRELHAHAWVEAHIPSDELPYGAFHRNEFRQAGAWLRLDPTPIDADAAELKAGAGVLAYVGQWMDYVQLLWNDYILGLNSERQRTSIYDPLVNGVRDVFTSLFSRQGWRDRFDRLGRALGIDWSDMRAADWFSWRAGAAAMLFSLVLVVMVSVVRPLGKRGFAWFNERRRPAREQARRRVQFYVRLEALLARYGMRREPGQTQREFAQSVGGQLADWPSQRNAASMPRRVVDAFYRVRFGGRALDEREARKVELALAKLEAALAEEKSQTGEASA